MAEVPHSGSQAPAAGTVDLVLHLGAHATDGGRIAGWLSENAETLSAQGLVLPAPRRFLALISRALAEHGQDGPASPAREAALLAELGIDDARRRLVVSAPGLLGPASQVIAPEGFYIKDVARRVYGLRVLFPRARLRFLLAVRRADGFLPALLSHLPPEAGDTLLPYLDDDVLPWSLLVETLRRHAPAAPLTVWRHEDLPKVWPQVLEALTGADAQVPVSGMTGLAVTGLSAEGRLRASRYLATNPPPDPVALQRVIAAFGARFGFDAAPQTDQAVPGWAQQHVRRLARSYETEWADIASQSGVAALG